MSWIIPSRQSLTSGLTKAGAFRKAEAEGGCGVVGMISEGFIEGRSLLRALWQMRNRGNGKGGGVAAAGLEHSQLGVRRSTLERNYMFQVAYLREGFVDKVEDEFIEPTFDVECEQEVIPAEDFKGIGLDVRPPAVKRYFCRVRDEVVRRFEEEHRIKEAEREEVEDEIVYRTSFMLNRKFYRELPAKEKAAFVLSCGKDMLVFKIVGYGHQVIQCYGLENLKAKLWIGHHRYPTKGRIWHPGGAHPFVAVNDVLVHNGDFANYHSIVEYLAQRGYEPLFHTDTEVAILLFDLWSRVYGMPLEYVLEAMAPTSERDFLMLPEEKRRIYRAIQAATIHGSPDGPWFFIIGRSLREGVKQLLGITDTAMLRPQVFALVYGPPKMGFIASERQAIDAVMESLLEEGLCDACVADLYWMARGGSYSDGGAFCFTLGDTLDCKDKFGREVSEEYLYSRGVPS